MHLHKIALCAALIGVSILGVKSAIPQDAANTPKEYQLQAARKDVTHKDDRFCSFFIWTTLDLTPATPRIEFFFDQRSDVVRVSNVTIQLDDAKAVPTALKTGVNDEGQDLWVFTMSQATYTANTSCIGGIKPKKK